MANKKLVQYIKNQLEAGIERRKIEEVLLKKGWAEQEVKKAFQEASTPGAELSTAEEAVGQRDYLPGPLSLLKKSFEAYQKKLFVYLGIVFLSAGATALLWFAFSLVFSFQGSIVSSSGLDISGFLTPRVLIPFFLVVLGNGLIQVWTLTSLFCAVRDRKKSKGVIAAFQEGWLKILPYIWVSFLMGLLIMTGSLFFFVPAIIFSVWFSFSAFIVVTEDIRGLNALLKSKRYVAGRWWSVFGREIAGSFIVAFMATVLSLVLSFTFGLLIGERGRDIASIGTMLFVPLGAIYSFLLYEELKRIKGEFSFAPKKKEKIIFLSIGLLGAAIMLAVIVGAVILLPSNLLSLQETREQAQDARIIVNMSQLRTTAALVYDGDYDELNLDHEMVASCARDIAEQGGDLVIKTGDSAYCAYTGLVSGGYYCISSSGSGRKTEKTPGATCNDHSFKCPEEEMTGFDSESMLH